MTAVLVLAVSCGPGRTTDDLSVSATSAGALGSAAAILAVAATNDDATVTYTLTYTGTHRYFRVYVDADQNAKTGFATATLGVELFVENGALYRYAGDGHTWDWTALTAPQFKNDGSHATWTIPRAALGEVDPCAGRSDLLFDIDDLAAPPLRETFFASSACPPAAGPSNGTATNDASNIYFGLDYAGHPSYWRVYIDTDENSATGFPTDSGTGAEYLVENGGLWQYAGGGWNWMSVGPVAFSVTGSHARWTLSRAAVGETSACGEASDVVFQTEEGVNVSTPLLRQTFTDLTTCASVMVAPPPIAPSPRSPAPSNHVFVVAMENEPASAVYGDARAPYINGVLFPKAARAGAFADPLPDGIPSEPHYVWMESGTNSFGDRTFLDDADPSAVNSTANTGHLVSQMKAANPPMTWLSFQEGLDAATGACPVSSSGLYAAKHNPFVFFQDVAGSPPASDNAYCAAHHRAYTTAAFGQYLSSGQVARYNFVTPDLCHDMHGASGCPIADAIQAGDQWLRDNLPPVIDFVNANGGVIFLVWDEPAGGSTFMPFFAIGPNVKRNYSSSIRYTHSSLTKSVEEILGLPVLPTVAGANDLADLFAAGSLP